MPTATPAGSVAREAVAPARCRARRRGVVASGARCRAVRPAAASNPLAAIRSASSGEARLPSCSTGRSGGRCRSASSAGRSVGGVELQPTFVERLRDEAADVRMHPPGPLEEEATVGRDRSARRRVGARAPTPRALGMRPLGDLRELVRVAEQDHVASRRRHRERVRERDLACLVDEQVVERAATISSREEPGGASRSSPSGRRKSSLLEPARRNGPIAAARLLHPPTRMRPPPARCLDLLARGCGSLGGLRRDADSLAGARDPRSGAPSRSCRARRTLDEEVAPVDAPRRGLSPGRAPPRLDGPRAARRSTASRRIRRPPATSDGPSRRSAARCAFVWTVRPGRSAAGAAVRTRPAGLEFAPPRRRRRRSPRPPALARSIRSPAEFVLLRRERKWTRSPSSPSPTRRELEPPIESASSIERPDVRSRGAKNGHQTGLASRR